MGHLNDLAKRYDSKGLTVIALTDENRSLVDAFVSATGATHPIVIEERDSTDDWDVKGFPTAYLIGPDGRILAEGWPNDAQIEKALEAVFLPPALPDGHPAVEKLLEKREYGAARKQLEKEIAEGGEGAAGLEAVRDWIDEAAKRKLAAAQAERSKDPAAAAALLRQIEECWEGAPAADEAVAARKELLSDAAAKKEVDAREALDKITAKIAGLKPKKAIPLVRSVARKFAGTKAGEEAARLLAKLEAQAN